MAEADNKSINKIPRILAIIIFIVSIAIFYLDPLNLQVTLYKVLILLLGSAIAIFIFLSSEDGLKFKTFLTQTKIELRKVIWPTKDETIKTTIMIIIAVFIVAIFLWLVDAFFTWSLQFLMN